ncbi:hypothetical protein NKI61_10730 [Mesorhizobium sp. M0514]|uniref:hypothetical protein n=1 Tax=Mesorhizobium sp. M0514 TaxID=2956955 RepID=UPI0033355583
MMVRPKWLKPSSMVDLCQVTLNVRPAFRTEVQGEVSDAEIGRWARLRGLYFCRDRDNFVVFSKRSVLVRRLLAIDQTAGEHTVLLGQWLGYPRCCARTARRIGEKHLDAWSIQISGRRHVGNFSLTSVSQYAAGRALISHIPCSAHCPASLRMATQVLARSHRFQQRTANVLSSRGFHEDGRRCSLPQ